MNTAQPYRQYVSDILAFIDYRTTPAFDYFGQHDPSDDLFEQLCVRVAPEDPRAFCTAVYPLLVLEGLGVESCTDRIEALVRAAAGE